MSQAPETQAEKYPKILTNVPRFNPEGFERTPEIILNIRRSVLMCAQEVVGRSDGQHVFKSRKR